MIKEFKEGHYYKWIGSEERPDYFNSEGLMNFILDGKPRKCLYGWKNCARFEGDDEDWFWHFEDFLEVNKIEKKQFLLDL